MKKVIPLIYTDNGKIRERIYQLKKIKNWARREGILLNTQYVSIFHESSWYQLKEAMAMTERGVADGSVLLSMDVIDDEDFSFRYKYVASYNEIPIVYINKRKHKI